MKNHRLAASRRATRRSVRAWAALRASSAEGRFDALHASGLTALVGREEEFALLLRRWSKANAAVSRDLPMPVGGRLPGRRKVRITK
jgi:hypothetical protein